MSVALADERTVIGRILQHIDAKTTDLAEGVWREPVANYLSQDRFEAEVAVMRRTPTPFCPSAALVEAGSYVARTAAMTPIVAIRGTDGVVRAFRNACRHRGAQLVDGTGCKAALTCRYHGWTYGTDGRLRGVPHEHGFPGLDKSRHGLVPVTAVEMHGVIFVTQDSEVAAGDDADMIEGVLGADWRLIGGGEQEIAANWKVVTEGVLEGYHIRATHPETFYPRQYDNLNLVEAYGRNSRVTYPFQAIERLRDAPAEAQKTSGVVTHIYHLFPNAAVATFPTHRILTIFEPLAIDRTRTVSYTLTNRPVEEPDQRAVVTKAFDFVNAGTDEDREVQMAVQRGLASGANEVFTFGLFEGAIGRLHKHLNEALDA